MGKKRIVFPFGANQGRGPMTTKSHHRVIEREQVLCDCLEKHSMIATWQVSATNRALEECISNKYNALCLEVEATTARRVTRCKQDLSLQAPHLELLAGLEGGIDGWDLH